METGKRGEAQRGEMRWDEMSEVVASSYLCIRELYITNLHTGMRSDLTLYSSIHLNELLSFSMTAVATSSCSKQGRSRHGLENLDWIRDYPSPSEKSKY